MGAGLLRATIALAALEANLVPGSFAQERPEVSETISHIGLPVSLLHAGSTAAEVERALGRPTVVADLGGPESGDAALVYTNEPVRTRVVLSAGKVTAIALDVVYVDPTSLPARARAIKATMRRGGVLGLLGAPAADRRWTEAGRDIEQMTYGKTDQEFSVFLADGLVVDVRPGDQAPSGIASMLLPTPVADAAVGGQLTIGLSPTQASPLLGSRVSDIRFALKGQPVEYASYRERDGADLVTVTFIGGVVTAFTIWPPDAL
jgi:hypothetical protein